MNEQMRKAFVEMYGEIQEHLPEDRWLAWFGIWGSGWKAGVEMERKSQAQADAYIEAETKHHQYVCAICDLPIDSGSFRGYGDGSGQSFAHEECYWRKEAERWESFAHMLEDRLSEEGKVRMRELEAKFKEEIKQSTSSPGAS